VLTTYEAGGEMLRAIAEFLGHERTAGLGQVPGSTRDALAESGWDVMTVALVLAVVILAIWLLEALRRCNAKEAEVHEARERFQATLEETTRVEREVTRELERELGAGRRELAKIRRTEQRYRQLFQSGPDIYLDVSDDHEVVSVNAFGLQALGCDEGSVIGRSFFSLVHRKDLIRLHETLRRVTDEPGSVEDLDCRLVADSGMDLWVNMRIRACVDDEHPGLRVVCRHITRHAPTPEAQRESERSESLGMLAGEIARDFDNVLVAILGSSGLIALELEGGAKASRFVREIERAAKRAAVLADRLLAYAGRGGGQKLVLELNQLVEEAVRLFTAILPGDSIVLDLAEDLPVFEGDPDQIGQALVNLIAKAADTLRGGGSLRFATLLETVDATTLAGIRFAEDLDPGDFVCVEIRALDSGDGGAPNRRRTTDDLGRDLGMACVLGVVRRHRGTIEVVDEAGETMLVRVRFPVGVDRAASDAGIAPLTASAGTILVIDNEEAIRTLAKSALELSGFDVLTAADSDQAIDLLQQHGDRVDVILLDVTMSGMSGEDMLERVRALGSSSAVIVSSGLGEADVRRRLPGTDCVFLEKPYLPFALVAKVLETIERTVD